MSLVIFGRKIEALLEAPDNFMMERAMKCFCDPIKT